jgi:hypothetical protein
MRMPIVLVVTLLVPAWAPAAPPGKFYYVGEAKLSSATGQPTGSQVFLVEKTHDRDKSTIIERAIVVQPDGKVEEWTMRLTAKEDNTFTLTDDSRKAEGSGKPLHRPPAAPGSRGHGGLSERGPAVVQALLLDLPDLLVAHAEALGDHLARLQDRHLLVLSFHQGQEDCPPLGLRQGLLSFVLRHAPLTGGVPAHARLYPPRLPCLQAELRSDLLAW